MCKFIGVEILAANALIEALEHENMAFVPYSKLEEYGIKVIKFLEEKYKEKAVILYNENQVGNRILNYSEYFNVTNEGIEVRESVTADELRKKFRAPLTYEILKAFLCEDIRKIITNG